MPGDERADRVSSRFSDRDQPNEPDEQAAAGEAQQADSQDDAAEETDLVRIQLRVPRDVRDDFQTVGYGQLFAEAEAVRGLDRSQLQTAAAQLLLDNPDLWAEKAEELYTDEISD